MGARCGKELRLRKSNCAKFTIRMQMLGKADKGGIPRGGFRGAGRTPPPQGFDPLPTQRVLTPLILFQKSIFGRPTLKFF